MEVKKLAEPLCSAREAIAVPLQKSLRGSWIWIWRPGVGMDPGAKEEDEDEKAAEEDFDATN